ncbi:hypothetical protein Cgig2_008856 [Carnegiea gigantea]|uniref:DUF4005 domain-containing protein n=1 Tax=Carnegiea gigantea TaxID=171969 RepID=A0A9Q1JHR1_9CARY|nr:hypothetical protein Cgig2_008856 [Carnegiea gigantea]
MGKTGKWFKSFWAGKKDQNKKSTNSANTNSSDQQTESQNQNQNPHPTTPVVIPRPATPTKEKKRWSFRRSSATSAATATPNKDLSPAEETAATPSPIGLSLEPEEKPALAEVVTADVAALAPVAAGGNIVVAVLQEAAAIKIQSVFRSYLARKALKALRGLVKLQALVRGHLVRKQATATLRCMQALVTAQARARAQRIRSAEDGKMMNHRNSTHRRNSQDKIKHSYHDMEENIKIVEMDHGEYYKSNIKGRNSYSVSSQHQQMNNDRADDKISTYYSSQRAYTTQDYQQISPAPSGITDMSPRTCSGHFEDYPFATAQSSLQCHSVMSRPDPSSQIPFSFPRPDVFAETMSYDYPLYPNYMANTESSRAKARSQSAPKQRPEFERQPSRGRRASVEGRGIPKGARMQRSSSHVGSTGQNLQYPWSIKLDKSTVSLVDSECGSNCSVFTNCNNYSKSVLSYDVSN